LLQVEQGLGIGTRAPFFNRMEAQCTRFWKLNNPRGKSAPVTLVTHGKLGNAVGDLPAYDAFLLGGPYSGAVKADQLTSVIGKLLAFTCAAQDM